MPLELAVGNVVVPDNHKIVADLVCGGDLACGHQAIAISCSSFRNWHRPKCQGKARVKWLEVRSAELHPVPNFYVSFRSKFTDALRDIFRLDKPFLACDHCPIW
jgi:hypothetical protein